MSKNRLSQPRRTSGRRRLKNLIDNPPICGNVYLTMKKRIALFLMLSAPALCLAQTNPIVFERLMSSSNACLMTNAEFRCFDGNRVLFRSGLDEYRAFPAAGLDAGVLKALGTSRAALDDKQAALDSTRLKAKQDRAAAEAAQAAAQYKYDHRGSSISTGVKPVKGDPVISGNFIGSSQ